ncbi:MAG: hypothetical protein LBF05_02910 [Tannerella sp.]|jgi:uncharacterized protein YndB with AHSA1/START domain|nr:hypothetical protein [Tannerella sp.]
MRKEKFHIEYIFDKVSKRSLWNQLTTPRGLSSWFADDVEVKGETYIFFWDKTPEKAKVIYIKPDICVRYQWLDQEGIVYSEFRIHTIELTGTVALEITDFAEPSEKTDAINLWDSQVDELKRTLGV